MHDEKTSRILIVLVDHRGQPKKAPVGYQINLSTTLGELSDSSVLLPAGSSSVTTTLKATGNPGVATVSATWGGGSDVANTSVVIRAGVSVRRPDDHLVFDLFFENLKLDRREPPVLVREDDAKGASLIVDFPPQSFGEQAFLETPPEIVSELPSAKVRMSGHSRLVFSMPRSMKVLPYTLNDILSAIKTWPMRLDASALPDKDQSLSSIHLEDVGFWVTSLIESPNWKAFVNACASRLNLEIPGAGEPTSIRSEVEYDTDSTSESYRESLVANVKSKIDEFLVKTPRVSRKAVTTEDVTDFLVKSTQALAATGMDFDLSWVPRLFFIPDILSPAEPPWNVTALELPYRLITSPLRPARWVHQLEPVEHQGRTELWHTRLTTSENDFGPDKQAKVRAIWSPDYLFSIAELNSRKELPFLMSLRPSQRKKLVINMAGFNEQARTGGPYYPRASQSRRLQISSLGGLLDVEGNWDSRPLISDLIQWRHLSTLGRDHFVKVVEAGYLCPFGHAAAKVTLTERKFESIGGDLDERVAVLRQRYYIIVRERVKDYDASNHEYGGNNFPFRSVEILTEVTPNLYKKGEGKSYLEEAEGMKIYEVKTINEEEIRIDEDTVFWPMSSETSDILFDIAATDINGNRVTFSMPLLYVGDQGNQEKASQIRAAYNQEHTSDRRRANFNGSKICYAPRKLDPQGDPKGDPQLQTDSITFNAGALHTEGKTYPNFYPQIEKTTVGIRPIQKLLNRPDAVVEMKYHQTYLDEGFSSSNKGEVFLQTLEDFELSFGAESGDSKSDSLGALVSPQMNINGLSRLIGPAADIDKIVDNTFNPSDYFYGAKFLGGIDLASILAGVTGLDSIAVPKMLSRELPDRVEASYIWETGVTKCNLLLIPDADSGKGSTKLKVNSVVSTPHKKPDETYYEASAEINNFKINLFGFIIVWFEELKFIAKKGQKTDVFVSLRQGEDAVQFGGALEFVNTLRDHIPSNGFLDASNLSITPSGISAGYSLSLPSLEIGIVSLSNVSLGSSFILPFDSKPCSIRFNFSERQDPFSLTVAMLGGGGFFAIAVSSEGVQEIEAALEFGAAVAINLGVASGGVEIKAGIYFHWLGSTYGDGLVELTGFVRLHGELSVLGLISASLTFNLSLSYEKIKYETVEESEPKGVSKVWGEATLVIEIEILFFNIDVSVTCRREFAGSESDPAFDDLIPDKSTWEEYCEAFALEVD